MLDQTDINIIEELSKNSRITMKELGEKVHLTGPAVSARVTKLEERGGCYLLECRFTSKKSMNSFLEQLNEYANYKLSIVID